MLTAENRILKEQIRALGDKMAVVQKALEKLSDRGNELRLSGRPHADRRRHAGSAPSAARSPPAVNAFLSGEAREVLAGPAVAP